MKSTPVYVRGSVQGPNLFPFVVVALLAGCSNAPSDIDAAEATKKFLADGGKLMGVAVPANVGISAVKVLQCKDATPLEGHYCQVNVVSNELPLLGAIAIPVTARFSKKQGNWHMFLN